MPKISKNYLSEAEIIKSLQYSGLYHDRTFNYDNSRFGTIIDGKKFYNKMISINSNFGHFKTSDEVVIEANRFFYTHVLANYSAWGINPGNR
ncbi:hypothetical protein [Lactiplantibacillus carotarum]|uniref:hypothetical protein n=1 Tax=Lactiplantibacillus carotarum TaxID=2993456 RepID=UPI00247AB952|nr:hypothetical protein [Lactiplantibacillus carotarum]